MSQSSKDPQDVPDTVKQDDIDALLSMILEPSNIDDVKKDQLEEGVTTPYSYSCCSKCDGSGTCSCSTLTPVPDYHCHGHLAETEHEGLSATLNLTTGNGSFKGSDKSEISRSNLIALPKLSQSFIGEFERLRNDEDSKGLMDHDVMNQRELVLPQMREQTMLLIKVYYTENSLNLMDALPRPFPISSGGFQLDLTPNKTPTLDLESVDIEDLLKQYNPKFTDDDDSMYGGTDGDSMYGGTDGDSMYGGLDESIGDSVKDEGIEGETPTRPNMLLSDIIAVPIMHQENPSDTEPTKNRRYRYEESNSMTWYDVGRLLASGEHADLKYGCYTSRIVPSGAKLSAVSDLSNLFPGSLPSHHRDRMALEEFLLCDVASSLDLKESTEFERQWHQGCRKRMSQIINQQEGYTRRHWPDHFDSRPHVLNCLDNNGLLCEWGLSSLDDSTCIRVNDESSVMNSTKGRIKQLSDTLAICEVALVVTDPDADYKMDLVSYCRSQPVNNFKSHWHTGAFFECCKGVVTSDDEEYHVACRARRRAMSIQTRDIKYDDDLPCALEQCRILNPTAEHCACYHSECPRNRNGEGVVRVNNNIEDILDEEEYTRHRGTRHGGRVPVREKTLRRLDRWLSVQMEERVELPSELTKACLQNKMVTRLRDSEESRRTSTYPATLLDQMTMRLSLLDDTSGDVKSDLVSSYWGPESSLDASLRDELLRERTPGLSDLPKHYLPRDWDDFSMDDLISRKAPDLQKITYRLPERQRKSGNSTDVLSALGGGMNLDNMLDNMIDQMTENDGVMQRLMETNPEVKELLQDKSFIKEQLQYMTNPKMKEEMTRSTDRQIANLNGVPGAFHQLTKLHNDMKRATAEENSHVPGGPPKDLQDDNPHVRHSPSVNPFETTNAFNVGRFGGLHSRSRLESSESDSILSDGYEFTDDPDAGLEDGPMSDISLEEI